MSDASKIANTNCIGNDVVVIAEPASWAELLSGGNALRAVALTGGVALHAINVHIVTTILPSVVRDIGGLDYYAWNITLFVAASIFGSTLTGKLLDVLGPRRTYLFALAIFSIGSILCATAQDMFWMLGGRSVQGIGGGLLAALSYALIRIVFAPRLWSRAVSLVSGMWGIATLLGPAVGGVFAESGAWRLAFWCLLPLSLAQALIVAAQLRGRQETGAPAVRMPLLKIALLTVSVLLVALAGQVQDDGGKLLGVAAGLALGVLVARLDRRPGVALLPSGAYTLSSTMGKVFACLSLLMIAGMTEIFVPYFLQTLHAYSPLQAGYMTAAMAGGWSLASLLSSGRGDADADRMVRAGPAIMALSLAALALLLPGDVLDGIAPATEGVCFAIALAGVGLGIGMGWPHLVTRVMKSARAGDENLASAGVSTVQLYAMSIGAALAGLTANAAGLSGSVTEPGGADGARMAAYCLFGLFALAPLTAIALARRLTAKQG
ncbi:arabinose efflux permease family protein [Herbaspirillum sp. CF444]|uniref:MFS transporter n=1 Tax=Herbaspirillum sp. CF444 TaxID=1144319 RepID=UPI0002727937|nr:MFS transporter [Herbaspirillum sp. CF444]EJL87916.1 arabinose efflux permease family protein [Herbaspirillum sp. CF444]